MNDYSNRYVEPKDFNAFRKNTDTLIGILNHNMTKMQMDVGWIKKIITWQTGILTGIFVALCVTICSGGMQWLGA